MLARLITAVAMTAPGAIVALAQPPASQPDPAAPRLLSPAPKAAQPSTARPEGWRAPEKLRSGRVTLTAGESEAAGHSEGAAPEAAGPQVARVTKGSGTLPNDQGQVWREYDISPYTRRVTSTNRPEQAMIDWILRETGYEAWHGETVALLSADQRTLRVYHTPEIQAVVSEIVDRFVASQAETQVFALKIITVGNPNWRTKAWRLMKPVPVQSQGVQGWLLAKEDAALLLAEMRKRTDYREHSSPHLLVNNGQSSVISSIRDRQYVSGILPQENTWPGYQPEIAKLEEGFALEFSPLLALDGGTVDAIIKLRLTQVEQMLPVTLEVSTAVAPRQRTRIEVPQVIACNLHERFRWPVDKVLLLSMGVVATPAPQNVNPLNDLLTMGTSSDRADALLFIEAKGKIEGATAAGQTAGTLRRRY